MEITVEYLRERLSEFEQQKEDALLQLGAVNGAKQLCNFLIQQLAEEGGPAKPPSPRKKRVRTRKPPPKDKENG